MAPASSSSSALIRRAKGFARFAVSVQYHGGSFLGFTYQGPQGEDCQRDQRKRNGGMGRRVDLRGYRSVEGRLREALDDLFGGKRWENIQVSSRTDRGVHALKNTFHVDIQMPTGYTNQCGDDDDDDGDGDGGRGDSNDNDTVAEERRDVHHKIERKLTDGLNFYLSRQAHGFDDNHNNNNNNNNNKSNPKAKQNPMMNELRILNASKSPERMDNPYALTEAGRAQNQPTEVDWNARFSATQRTYVYRILCYNPRKRHERQQERERSSSGGVDPFAYGIPFEWDRAWCLPEARPLDLAAMREAADFMVGTHDFSSFRGRLCQRHSPFVSMESVTIDTVENANGFFGGTVQQRQQLLLGQPQLVTITFVANSFLYRQVRNMVGCLVEVGNHRGKLTPKDVEELLGCRKEDESDKVTSRWRGTKFKHRPYSTAPPQGLFLVDVQHGGFRI